MIKLEGCVERELELLTMLTSLWPQGGTPGPLGCPRAGEGGVAGPVSYPNCLLCFSAKHLPMAAVPQSLS